MTRRGEWATIDITAAYILAVVLFAFLYRGPLEAKWLLVQATIEDTRIVADHELQTEGAGR